MSIAITEDHQSLADTAADFLRPARRARRGPGAARGAGRGAARPAGASSSSSAGSGCTCPRTHGGSGYGLEELVVVVEELGRAVAPGPFVPTVIASAVLAAAGDRRRRGSLLPGLADGSAIGAVALGGIVTRRRRHGVGHAGIVLGGGLADVLLVAVGDDVAVVERRRRRHGRRAAEPRPDPPRPRASPSTARRPPCSPARGACSSTSPA